MSAGALVLDNLTKTFQTPEGKRITAVDGAALTIAKGEFVTLLGPSGCGKTTTLRMIAGFEYGDSGRILLDGKDIATLPPNKREMAMVFQSYALFPHLNVRENVAYGLELKRLPKSEVEQIVRNTLALVGLEGKERRRPSELSGGQQQRVALARAMAVQPKVLLFDEPLSNLDAKLRVSLRVEIRRLQKQLGITSVYVTHDQAEAMSLSDNVVVMNAGRIEQVGAPVEIYARPANRFVADFIGRANFLPAKVLGVEARQASQASPVATVDVFGQVMQVPAHPALAANGQAELVVRPEAVRVNKTGAGFPARVKLATYLGHTVDYELDAFGQTIAVEDYDAFIGRIFHEGDELRWAFEPERAFALSA